MSLSFPLLNRLLLFLEVGEPTKNVMIYSDWGCGAFKGDFQLKSLLQWMVAAGFLLTHHLITRIEVGRPLAYYTWKEGKNATDLYHIKKVLTALSVTNGKYKPSSSKNFKVYYGKPFSNFLIINNK